ncbi:Glycosyltransferase involved in cell wall bisynthesis [Methylobacterium sp. 275MFSha3.1]|uniref:glycosyltransferase family 2 protein n=1 Tax=Methylobacterium sp. 275MFSha3.1 TaxID=1502746 RepID=UPI0008A7C0B5|nr:glycosyltransferase family 2 protein [Methylobacterium sp. 275MFSha3.1]SEI10113.1 Glycosyltransferase involved in cell wall bisynthesis [Methylobacterium sp. 275MFSha3.1]
MTEPLLSICLPTYNRADFLGYLLGQAAETWTFAFPYEILVADNASADDTEAVVRKYADLGLPIRYYRQSENKGGGPNLLTAFHRARGQYVLYLADDDLLNPAAVEETMSFLSAHPEVRAAYAPWQLYDDVAKRSVGEFFTIDQDVIFRPGQEGDLLDLIIERHIFPEIVIYRADAVRRIMAWPRFCFWPFVFLANTIEQGPIAFLRRPYYRSVVNTAVRAHRRQEGIEEVMTGWDTYRGGLEYFVYTTLKRTGVSLAKETRQAVQDMIDRFIAERMRVALRLWLERGDYLNAYDVACRLSFRDPALVRNIPGVERLPLLLVMQKLARFTNAIGGVERLELVGIDEADHVMPLLRQAGLEDRITLNAGASPPTCDQPENSIVFLARESDRQICLDRGYAPNLVISEPELLTGLHPPA